MSVRADRHTASTPASRLTADEEPASPEGGARATQWPSVSHANCFDALRLIAASAVLLSHSFALSGHHEPSIGSDNVGTLAVLAFFAISGFLIPQSWRREPRLGRYLLKRALRIMPALIVVLLATVLVLGPLVTTWPLRSYLGSTESWLYFPRNATFRALGELPGVFAGNPYPRAVNGSLWTLTPEIHTYLLVAALGFVGVLRGRLTSTAAFVAVVLVSVLAPNLNAMALGDAPAIQAFAFGALLYLWHDRLPAQAWTVAALLAIWISLANTGAGRILAALAVAQATIFIGSRAPTFLRGLTRRGDLSYGLYVWAFPIQQTTAFVWKGVSALELTAVAFPVTALLASMSWTLIEKPALRLKSRSLWSKPR
jgi:peptidoglycan/LPS O-acetylase OafA/YrhL